MGRKEKLQATKDYDREYRQFRKANPGARFGDFYAQKALESINRNIPHATLGKRLRSGQEWPQAGVKQLQFLKRQGLKPHHRLVDFGCGSLLVGQHLIRYLDPGHYWGLDITDVFIEMGVEQLPPGLLAEREPRFRIIDPSVLEEARRIEADFVYSRAVLRHVPPEELSEFFTRIMSLLGKKTRLLITGITASSIARVSPNSWAFPESLIREHVERCGGTAEFEAKPGHIEGAEDPQSIQKVTIHVMRA
jgi:SAM-dependent methyltransferase